MKKNWLFLLWVPLFCACEPVVEKKVTTKIQVYNEVYDNNNLIFGKVIEKLEKIVKNNNFELGTYDIENLAPDEVSRVTSLLKTEEIRLKTKVPGYEILAIYDDFLSILDSEKVEKENAGLEDYYMSFLRGSDFSFLTSRSATYRYLMKRKAYGSWDSIVSNDSITYNDKVRIERSIQEDMDKIKSLKYVLLIDDLFVMDAEMMDDNSFKSGTIVTLTKLINLKSKKVEAQKVFLIKNSDKVEVATGGSEAFDKMNIRLNIMAKKVEKLNRFYKFN